MAPLLDESFHAETWSHHQETCSTTALPNDLTGDGVSGVKRSQSMASVHADVVTYNDSATSDSSGTTANTERKDTPMSSEGEITGSNGKADAGKAQSAHLALQEVLGDGTCDAEVSLLTQTVPALEDDVILEPFRYLSSLPGKGVRDLAINALNCWLEVPEEMTGVIKMATNMLHSSSLMLDDLEDRSPLRRGKPSTHTIYGPASTINSATFLYINVINVLGKLNNSQAITVYTEEMRSLFIGQSYDIHWTESLKCPSVTDYLRMIDGKTGGLFRFFARLLIAMSPHQHHHTSSLDHLCALLGRYFQIRDDYQNLASSDYTAQKGFCEDLDEGKYSLPLIYTVNNTSDMMLLSGLLQCRRFGGGLTFEQKVLMLEHIKASGSLDYTLHVLHTLYVEIDTEIGKLERHFGKDNMQLRRLLAMLKV
ncbi:isoprenoid synthase domain-containing protein [Massariosphaeria phaeospora]|uniref:geranylgeranyl diphosphate synthase n=1 Tax=Massariosphaeria phaeospora TaxID=100035 RepID=A0A7C8I0V5_9PLEO|nr:isoprenoid synthase domain-containing protein [Massariosphaeria phaeospora]